MKHLITIILTLVFQSITYAATVKDFTATYDLYHNEFYVGKSERSLNTENKNLTFSSIAETAGVAAWFFNITITEISKLRLKNKRLNFVSYSYNEKDSDKNKGYQLYLEKTHNFYNTHTKQLYGLVGPKGVCDNDPGRQFYLCTRSGSRCNKVA